MPAESDLKYATAQRRAWTIPERILRAFSRDPAAPDYAGGTVKTNLANSLEFMCKLVPQFPSIIKGKRVLDHGCGWGWQALAVASHAREVVAFDTNREWRALAEKKVREHGAANLKVVSSTEGLEPFDVVYSCSAIEHYADPSHEISVMKSVLRPDGKIVIAFAEPWLSPHGSHTDNFTRLPWVNVFFSEKTVLGVRSLYRDDGAKRYEEIRGGLNRMTLTKFERIIRENGLKIDYRCYQSVKRIPLVSRIPLVREFWTAAAAVVLSR